MIADDLKYVDIIDIVKAQICANCKNITSYSSIPDYFKSGWSYSGTATKVNSFWPKYTNKYTISLTANSVSQEYASTVTSQLNSYLSDNWSGYYDNTTLVVSDADYMRFIRNIISFVCNRVKFAVAASPIPGNSTSYTYMVYYSGYTDYPTIERTYSALEYLKIDSSEFLNNLISITDVVNRKNRIIAPFYEITYLY